MKQKGFTLVEAMIASILVLIIVVGFSASIMGFSGVTNSSFHGLTKGSQFTSDKMQAQELLGDKITAVKRDYNNAKFNASSTADKDVLAETQVTFRTDRHVQSSTDNMKFDLLIVDPAVSPSPTTGVQKLNIPDVRMNISDLEINYKPLLVPSDTSVLKYKSDTQLAYLVAKLNTEKLHSTPIITELTMNVRDGGSSIAYASNDFTAGGKLRELYYKGQNEDSLPASKKIMSTDISSLRLEEKMKDADAGTKVYYEWYKTKDVTYNVPASNYYKGTTADNYSDSGSEAEKYKELFPVFDVNNYSNHYLLLTNRNNKKLKPNTADDYFPEFYGASYVATAKPISSRLIPGERRESPSVYLGPQYINVDGTNAYGDLSLRFDLNASWIDVRDGSGYIDRVGGVRYLNAIPNFVANGTYAENLKIEYAPSTARVSLLQPDSNNVYMRSRYINLGSDGGSWPKLSFRLHKGNEYTIVAVVRNNDAWNQGPVLRKLKLYRTWQNGGNSFFEANLQDWEWDRYLRVFDINLEPINYQKPMGYEKFWHLEYLTLDTTSKIELGDIDADIAELIIFKGNLEVGYRNRLLHSLAARYAPVNSVLDVADYQIEYRKVVNKGDLFFPPAAIGSSTVDKLVKFKNGKYGMAAIEFDDLEAVLQTNQGNFTGVKATYTFDAHIKGDKSKKIKYILEVK